MTKELTRHLTFEERQVFAGKIGLHGSFYRSMRGFLIVLIFTGVFSSVAAFFQRQFPLIRENQNFVLTVIFLAGVVLAIWLDSRNKYPSYAGRFIGELKQGNGLVRQFDVVDAIRVGELEDNGYSFYLRLANGEVLFLSGQYLYEPTDNKEFPSSKLEIVYSPVSRFVLSLECAGNYVVPLSELPAPTLEELESGEVPDDGAILDVDFERLKK